jgi:hypothetical protein
VSTLKEISELKNEIMKLTSSLRVMKSSPEKNDELSEEEEDFKRK